MESSKVYIAVFKWIYKNCKLWLQHKHLNFFDDSEIEWIITVPAIWNDEAKYLMQSWAKLSGLDNNRIVYESDCASLAMQYRINTSK